jgi:hypothetical protein
MAHPTNFVICTIDHKVFADGQWIPAGEVKPGMKVQIETLAQKSQFGKITKKGCSPPAALRFPEREFLK